MDHVPFVELRCAGLVASLEGYKKILLRQHDRSMTADLPSLEERLRAIEKTMEVISPPPDAEPSWIGLATRLQRLRNMAIAQFPWVIMATKTRKMEQDFQSMLQAEDITVDVIKKVVDGIRTEAPYIEWPKHNNNEESTSFALQKLCYIVGWRGNVLREMPVTPVEIYSRAIQMTHMAELHGPGRSRPLPRTTPLPPGVSMKPRKPCCNCCSCTCHHPVQSRRGRSSSSVSSRRDSSMSSVRPVGRFQWLRKLFFWQKKAVDDASSASSSSRSRRNFFKRL